MCVPLHGDGTRIATLDKGVVEPLLCPEVDGTEPEYLLEYSPSPNNLSGVRFCREGHGKATGTDEDSATFDKGKITHEDVTVRRWGEITCKRKEKSAENVHKPDPLTYMLPYESM